MANVRKYTEQIASAKKGKDVRAAIVSAINEVSDENNTYNQTKADIQAAQKSINADVTKNQQTQQAFNSNLQEAKEVQKDLTAKMNKGTTLAENLEKKNTTATSCLLYTSDAADEEDSVELGRRRILKKQKKHGQMHLTHEDVVYLRLRRRVSDENKK